MHPAPPQSHLRRVHTEAYVRFFYLNAYRFHVGAPGGEVCTSYCANAGCHLMNLNSEVDAKTEATFLLGWFGGLTSTCARFKHARIARFPASDWGFAFPRRPVAPLSRQKKKRQRYSHFFFFFTYHFTFISFKLQSVFTFAFFFFSSLLPHLPPLPTLQYSISFQVQSPISYLANTFSTSVKFIFCNFIGFPPVSQVEGKGSHYSLVLQPCPPPSTQPGEEGEKKKKRK